MSDTLLEFTDADGMPVAIDALHVALVSDDSGGDEGVVLTWVGTAMGHGYHVLHTYADVMQRIREARGVRDP